MNGFEFDLRPLIVLMIVIGMVVGCGCMKAREFLCNHVAVGWKP